MECSEVNVKKVKKCLISKIKKEESILECATVKLSICSPQTGKIFRSLDKEGILCVIVDRNKSCLYLKQYDIIEFKVVFAIELYMNISDGYTVCDNYFHTIEYPGFFLGLSFPILDNPNVANRSSLIQKAIISTSKFISIKLSEYMYLHEFDSNKVFNKKGLKSKSGSEKRTSFSKTQKNPKIINNILDKISVGSKDNNIDNENNINNKSNENNIEQESSKKVNNIKENENNKEQEAPNQPQKNDEVTKENNNNEINNNNNNLEENNINNTNNNIQKEDEKINTKKPMTEEEKEKNFFDNIIIQELPKPKIYKIVQYHYIREKNKVVKKIYSKNFNRFIDANKISFENIKNYKINTYDYLNDVYSSSEEGEKEKTFVDYVPSKDMIGDLEDVHIDDEDERVKELRQIRNNFKEIMEKTNANDKSIFKTTAIYSNNE